MELRIAGASVNQIPIDWGNNIENITEAIRLAKKDQVDILCFPELCITGYGCEDLFLSEWLPQKAATFLPAIQELCENIMVVVGLPVRHEGILYNCACVIKDKKIIGLTPKQHLANDGVHYERRWFNPAPPQWVTETQINGKSCPFGALTYDYQGIKIGFEICEDAWQQNLRPGYQLKEQKVDLILNPSASHFAFGKTEDRLKLVVESSKIFNCTYLYSNLLGNEAGRMIYDGEILISQKGTLVQRNALLSYKNINICHSLMDFKNPEKTPIKIQHYPEGKNTEFIKATSLGLFDYWRKSKTHGFVLSLSGGADSATCAIIVAEAIKRAIGELGLKSFLEKVHMQTLFESLQNNTSGEIVKILTHRFLSCAYQATKNSSQKTFDAAKALAKDIGAGFYSWNIDDEVELNISKIEKTLKRKLSWEQDDIPLQNIQARARSPIIWLLANVKHALLLTTSNRSEGDVGYATMDGDTSGSLAPIAGVDKFFIQKWLVWAEKELSYESLKYINNLQPSAELRPKHHHQIDEKDLMPYHVLVEIEKAAIRDRLLPIQVFEKLSGKGEYSSENLRQYIMRFFKLWSRNQWKRERIAPSLHLDDFNVDPKTWCRFPILSGSFQDELRQLLSLKI